MKHTSVVVGLFVGALVIGFLLRSREGFAQKDAGMPLDGPAMGPYDTSMGGWMSSEHMPVGVLPQNQALEQNKLMLMVDNRVSSECCPAAFTTDTGCVCLTGQQKDLFSRRGGNK